VGKKKTLPLSIIRERCEKTVWASSQIKVERVSDGRGFSAGGFLPPFFFSHFLYLMGKVMLVGGGSWGRWLSGETLVDTLKM